MLQAGRRCNVNKLAEEVGVSRRTIFRDVSVLKDAGIQIAFDDDTETYNIEQSYYLKPMNLTLEEGLAVMLMTRKMADARVLPMVGSIVSAGLKIESALPEDVVKHCGEMLQGVEFDWPQVSDVDSVSDILYRIQQAIANQRKLRIAYESYHEKSEIQTTLRPYRALFRGRGWYVIGHSEMHGELRTFKLERIIALHETDAHFTPDHTFTVETYFGNAWNLIRGDTRYHVEITFSAKVAGNVEEVAWHPTQRTRRRSDGTLVFEVDVDGIDEIAWWILGYGDQAIVCEPEPLRQLIASHARNMLRYVDMHENKPIERP